MGKSNKVLYIIIVVCAILVICLCAFLIINHEEDVLTDAERFKRDFEQYNGLVYEDTNDAVIDVSIPEDNPFIYKTGKEIVEVLENETAYILFGYASSPLTRAAIEALIEVLDEQNIENVYYVDISDMRDEYAAGSSIIPDKIKEGSPAYEEILSFFSDNLSRYYVSDETGFYLYDTGTTRLLDPTFAAVSDGEVIAMHEELVEDYVYSNKELTEEEKAELKEYYYQVVMALTEE